MCTIFNTLQPLHTQRFFHSQLLFFLGVSTTTQTIRFQQLEVLMPHAPFSSWNNFNHTTILSTLQPLHTQRFFTANCFIFLCVLDSYPNKLILTIGGFCATCTFFLQKRLQPKVNTNTLQPIHTQRFFHKPTAIICSAYSTVNLINEF